MDAKTFAKLGSAAKRVVTNNELGMEGKAYREYEYLMNSATHDANRWFDHVKYILEGAVRDIEKYKRDFHEALTKEGGMATPTDVLSWAVNGTSHIESNLRKSDTLRIAATLTIAANMKKGAAE